MPAPARDDAPWSDLGGGVLVRRSRAFHMNSGVLLDRGHTLLVDPGLLPSELDEIARRVEEASPREVTLFLTHGDWDHVLGRPWWPGAQVVAHAGLGAEVAREAGSIRADADELAAGHGERWERPFRPFRPTEAVRGQLFLRFGPWRAVFRDAPGHSDTQLTLHLPEQGVLFAADMLSDVEIPMLNGPPGRYRATLEGLAPLIVHGAIRALVPGHGSVAADPAAIRARLEADLAYLDALVEGVASARARGQSLDEAQAALAGMPGLERHPAYPMAPVQRDNVAHAWAAAPGPAQRR